MMMESELLAIGTLYGLRGISSFDAATIELTVAGVSYILGLCQALWLHSGNPSDPHGQGVNFSLIVFGLALFGISRAAFF